MKKTSKILSAFLALVMAFALAVPAFAAEPGSIDIGAVNDGWGNGTKLVLTNVVGQESSAGKGMPWEGTIYDVSVGGELTLYMEFPAGANRVYGYRLFGATVDSAGRFTDEGWSLPFTAPDVVAADMGMDHYTITCTQDMVGKLIALDIWWMDADAEGLGTDDGIYLGYIRVVNADGTAPAQPSTTPAGAKPAPGKSVLLNDGSGEYLYTIKSGDNLKKLAKFYYGSESAYKLIYERNKDTVKNPDMIYAGQTLILPSYAAVDAFLNPAPTQPAVPEKPTVEAGTYTVKAGDNLSKIAKAIYGDATKWGVIYEANKGILKSPSRIYPGQVLVIPAL